MAEIVLRPFADLPNEPDWVAMREILPAATAQARTTKEYGAKDITIVSMLPMSWPALHREDGQVFVALQTTAASNDPSRDFAAAALAAIDAEPGTNIEKVTVTDETPRLQDVIDASAGFDITVHEGFDFWFADDAELDAETKGALEEANNTVIESWAVTDVPHAFCARMGQKIFLRWARDEDEDAVIDGLSRLQGQRAARIADGKLLGAFRTSGIVIPVWELPRNATSAEIDEAVQAFAPGLTAAIAETGDLDANARRARGGIVARQLTLR